MFKHKEDRWKIVPRLPNEDKTKKNWLSGSRILKDEVEGTEN